jgi:hypothetical protein
MGQRARFVFKLKGIGIPSTSEQTPFKELY